MNSDPTTPFVSFIRRLRQNEEVLIFGNTFSVSVEDENAVAAFLEEEFKREALDFPEGGPSFDRRAAVWAATDAYRCAQLILYRDHAPEDLGTVLQAYTGNMNASAIVSADLCLRFLPSMIQQLKLIDQEDPLIELIEERLYQWHFSAVSYPLDNQKLDFNTVGSDRCLLALYVNRITSYRNLTLSTHPVFAGSIRASMGMYGTTLWKEFTDSLNKS
ncbi:hypothetical protein WBG78_27610 [Chryseolinea sp. T2]|uniref:hypothetical protein n=1 Tax=Chryseolinea sp. T2 TaxID=3129255 RepID=UPI003078555C